MEFVNFSPPAHYVGANLTTAIHILAFGDLSTIVFVRYENESECRRNECISVDVLCAQVTTQLSRTFTTRKFVRKGIVKLDYGLNDIYKIK